MMSFQAGSDSVLTVAGSDARLHNLLQRPEMLHIILRMLTVGLLVSSPAFAEPEPPCGLEDSDGDGVGDDCDVCDGGDDTIDSDGDGVPDDCDPCPTLAFAVDSDGDGVCDDVDLCPDVYDPDQKDTDGDGWGDACDACPHNPMAGPMLIAWYVDADGDGQGVESEPVYSCERPMGRADNTNDCDDTNRYIRLGAPEVCDGLDNDCDGIVDFEGCELWSPPTWSDDLPAPGLEDGCRTVPVSSGLLATLAAAFLVRRRRDATSAS